MSPPAILQLISILLFIHGAWLYYAIRRLLHRKGYPVSIFVYSGSCWPHYKHLIDSTPPPARNQLKMRKLLMTASFVAALILLIASSCISYIL